ncbi:MAG: hypothetical protein RJA39_632 [Pseudomonadota bacterium]
MKTKNMTTQLLKLSVFLSAALCASMALANSPVGQWHTLDDKTGEVKSVVVIFEQQGVVRGRVEKVLRKDADPAAKCDKCSDDRKNQPVVGLEIIRGAKKASGKNVWEDGEILDPENGRTYTLRLTPIENGAKLEVRGSFGPIGRTQTWVRVP